MSYNIKIAEKENYLRVEVSGKRTPGRETQDALEYLSKVMAFSKQKKIFSILIIATLTGDLPLLTAYEVAHKPEESFGFDRRFRLASVDLNEASRKENRFIETFSGNRGYDIKIFDNEPEALQWLHE